MRKSRIVVIILAAALLLRAMPSSLHALPVHATKSTQQLIKEQEEEN